VILPADPSPCSVPRTQVLRQRVLQLARHQHHQQLRQLYLLSYDFYRQNAHCQATLPYLCVPRLTGGTRDYSFPFKIVTPANLPGSFNRCIHTEAHIQYLLSGYLSSSTVKVKRVKAEVTQVMSEAIVSLQDSVSAQITTCCCLRKGEVKLSATISKSAYVPGEMCNLNIEVDNSKALFDVTAFKGSLFRTLCLRSNNGSTFWIKLPVTEGTGGNGRI